MAAPFPTTLVIMYFVTTPVNVPDGQPKEIQEQNANWTLQATSQIPTEDPKSCLSIGVKMTKEFLPVNTSTIRAYCICPVGSEEEVCLNREEQQQAAFRKLQIERNKDVETFRAPDPVKTSSPRLLRIGPDTPDPFAAPKKDSRGR